MKTKLPKSINTVDEAKAFLTELYKNKEAYHPEDDAHDILWQTASPTPEECDHLNKLMDDIYELNAFDPCEFILKLDPAYGTF